MSKSNPIRRIRPGAPAVLLPSGPPSDQSPLATPLETSLGKPLEEQHQNRRRGGLAVSARHPVPDARAAALFEQNEVGCLRALANLSPSFHSNSPLPRPAARCERSRAPRWPGQKARGGQRRKLACERSAKAFPKMPARASAPDPPAFRSLRSLQYKPGGQARYALSPCSLGLAKLPETPAARWEALATSAGDSAPALGGLRELSLEGAKVLAAFARSWGALRNRECFRPSRRSLGCARKQAARPAPVAGATCAQVSAGERGNLLAQPARAASARPKARGFLLRQTPIAAQRKFKQGSNGFQSTLNPLQTIFKQRQTPVRRVFSQDSKVFSKGAIDYASY